MGHIDCRKDTYKFLNKSIAKPLNNSLQRLKNAVIFVPNCIYRIIEETSKSDTDSSRRSETDRPVYLVPRNDKLPEPNDKMYNIKFLAVGDLAFVSMALGKIDMGGKWCPLCDLSPKHWKELDHEQEEVMTLQRMELIRIAIQNKEVTDTPSNRKGCVDVPLFPVFQSWDLVNPCLHVMMNDDFVAWLKYIDARHERVPLKEREAREWYWDTLNSLCNVEEEFKAWTERQEPHLSELQESINECNEKQKQRNRSTRSTTIKHFYSLEQRKNFGILIQGWKEDIKQVKKIKKPTQENIIKDQQQLINTRKKYLQKIQEE